MLTKTKRTILLITAILFIFLGIIAITNQIFNKNIDHIFWLSYTTLILIGIGMLRKDSFLIATQLNIITIPYLVWTIDFLYLLITNNSLWGITNYILLPGPILPKIVTLQHIYNIPFSLLALYLIKLDKKDMWKASLIQITAIFILTFFLTSPGSNINCVFQSCLPFISSGKFYLLTWFSLSSLAVLVTNYIYVKLPFLKVKKPNQ